MPCFEFAYTNIQREKSIKRKMNKNVGYFSSFASVVFVAKW